MVKDSKNKSKIVRNGNSDGRRGSSKTTYHNKSKVNGNNNNNNSNNSNKLEPKNHSTLISAVPMKGTNKMSELQLKFAKKLQGSRFRMINESLYTKTGKDSLVEFQSNPTLFKQYHEGFREQASQWPENPLHKIINWVNTIVNDPRKVIADMGCGDAELSRQVKNKVYSFDLLSTNPSVIAADIAHVPLANESVDIVVFCLSLMGTNIIDFLAEAHRILKMNGILKIVEVRSRFESTSSVSDNVDTNTTSSTTSKNHGNNTKNTSSNTTSSKGGRKRNDGIKKFLKIVKRIGFRLSTTSTNSSSSSSNSDSNNDAHINTMFFQIECIKITKIAQIDMNDLSAPNDDHNDDANLNKNNNNNKNDNNNNNNNNDEEEEEGRSPMHTSAATTTKAKRPKNKTNKTIATVTADTVKVVAIPQKSPNTSFSAKACVYKKR